MHLSFFLFHSWWCLSIREPRQSIDPFEVMSHQSSPSSFLQSYCECRLNDQKGELEVGVQGCVCRFDCLECILNNQIDFWCVTYDHLICCEFVFIYFFSIYNFKFLGELPKTLVSTTNFLQNLKAYSTIVQVA
jgi:hypothetical protein